MKHESVIVIECRGAEGTTMEAVGKEDFLGRLRHKRYGENPQIIHPDGAVDTRSLRGLIVIDGFMVNPPVIETMVRVSEMLDGIESATTDVLTPPVRR